MTCFRIGNETVYKFCKKNGISYASFWRKIEKGASVEESIEWAKNSQKRVWSHPKHFYNGYPIVTLLGYNSIPYRRVMHKIRRGKSVEEAIKDFLPESVV